jgi:REP element-mobilizing transposase RayT
MIHSRIKKANEIDPDSPWHSRGYLPHFDGEETLQFVTYRLHGSLPRTFLSKLKVRLDTKQITEIEYHREVERYLGLAEGPQYLADENVAAMIEENLLRFDGVKYLLLHWVIMSNHIHLLLRLLAGHSLASVMHSIKSYTANQANKILGGNGPFWSVEYYDRYMRNAAHYANTVSYIHRNPVKAGLCVEAKDWRFGCAGRTAGCQPASETGVDSRRREHD